MAYGKRAYSTFFQQLTGTQIDIEILQDGFDPAGALPMLLSDTPITTRLLPDGDKYTIIKGRECAINIVVTQSDDYSWLYTTNDRELMVVIKEATVTEWTGFVVVDQYNEELSPVRILSVLVNDQLGMLDTQPYTFGNPAVSPTGYDTIMSILAKILSGATTTKTGLSLNIINCIGLYDVAMDHTDTDDPFFQASVNQSLWVRDDGTAWDCMSVIEDMLKDFLCRIFQSSGKWYIQRVPEMAVTSIKYREFSTLGAYVGNGSFNPQVTSFTKLATASLQFTSGWKNRILDIDYGLLPSLIPSFNLPDSAFTADNPAAITGWTNTAGWWRRFVPAKGNILVAYTDGKYLNDVDYDLSGAGSLYLVMPSFTVTTVDTFDFSIDCGRSVGALFAPRCRIELLVYVGGDIADPLNYYSYEQSPGINQYTWTNGLGGELRDIEFKKVQTMAELVTQTTTIPAPPYNGTMILRISAPYRAALSTSDSNVYIANIRLTSQIDEATDKLTGMSFLHEIQSQTNFIPQNESIRLGDGLSTALAPFYRGFIKVGSVVTSSWQNSFSTPVFLPLTPDSETPANNCIMDSWYQQYATQNKRFTGTLRGVIHYHNTIVIDSVVYLLNDVEIDLKRCQYFGSFIELKPETLGNGLGTITMLNRMTDTGKLITNNGLIPNPGGLDNEIQFKSGGDFAGTTGVTFDGTRILKGGTLPLIEYRAGTETVASGEQTITFAEPFVAGDDYALMPIWGLTGDNDTITTEPYDLVIAGFKVNFEVGCTFSYLAIIKR